MKHSLFGFSSLERRSSCPGSYRMEKDLPELPPAKNTPPGDRLHKQVELMIKADRLGNPVTVNPEEFNATEIEAAIFCFDQYKAMAYEPMTNYKIITEKSFDFRDLFPEIEISTTDLIGYEPFKVAHVFDWKFNYGEIEEAPNNIQLGGYALGAFKEFDVKTVYVHLVEAFARRVSSYQYIESEQKNIIDFVKLTISNCFKSFAPLKPSKKSCQYCRANTPNNCPAILGKMFDAELTTPLSAMQPEDISKLLDIVDLNISIGGKIKQYVYACMTQGCKVPGWILAKGRNSREWMPEVNEQKLIEIGKMLEKDVSNLSKTELIGIVELEERWGKSAIVKNHLMPLIKKEEGKPILKKEKS